MCGRRGQAGAGSEINRPDTDASAWPGVSTIVWLFVATVSPPASVSSRTVSSKNRDRSSSENISWPATVLVASGRRPSRETTVYGAPVAGACIAAIDSWTTTATRAGVTMGMLNDTKELRPARDQCQRGKAR